MNTLRHALTALFGAVLFSCQNQAITADAVTNQSAYFIIRKMDYPIVKRPDAETEVKALLLEVWPGGGELAATPYIDVEINGVKTMCAFAVRKVFKSDKQALSYAKEHGILDVDVSGM